MKCGAWVKCKEYRTLPERQTKKYYNTTEIELLKNVMNRQLQFFGHVMRKKKLEHVVIRGKIRRKRARGRQRLKFMDQMKDVLGGSTEEILRAVNDRDGWRNKYREAVGRLASAHDT